MDSYESTIWQVRITNDHEEDHIINGMSRSNKGNLSLNIRYICREANPVQYEMTISYKEEA